MSGGIRGAWFWAVAGVALSGIGQILLAYGLYGGDLSGLFYTGTDVRLPAIVAAEDIPRAPDAVGFDGQYYHFIAHDPLMRSDARALVDNPPLRWRRILVPGLAYGLALGRTSAIDLTYVVVLLGFTFWGILRLGYFAVEHGLPAWTALAFLLLPATTISLERMTVDVALGALAVTFAVQLERLPAAPSPWFYAVLAAAPFARETGAALAAALAVVRLAERRFAAALKAAVSLAPFAAWSLYVHARAGGDATPWFGGVPFGGLLWRTFEPFPVPGPSLGHQIAAGLEYLAILGVWVSLFLVARRLAGNWRDPLAVASGLLLALFAFLAKEDIWLEVYGFGRTLSPVLLWLGMIAARERRWVLAAPWALVAPRVLYQLALLGWASFNNV